MGEHFINIFIVDGGFVTELAHVEVSYFQIAALPVKQNVVWLQVPVHHPVGVHVSDCIEQLLKKVNTR